MYHKLMETLLFKWQSMNFKQKYAQLNNFSFHFSLLKRVWFFKEFENSSHVWKST